MHKNRRTGVAKIVRGEQGLTRMRPRELLTILVLEGPLPREFWTQISLSNSSSTAILDSDWSNYLEIAPKMTGSDIQCAIKLLRCHQNVPIQASKPLPKIEFSTHESNNILYLTREQDENKKNLHSTTKKMKTQLQILFWSPFGNGSIT